MVVSLGFYFDLHPSYWIYWQFNLWFNTNKFLGRLYIGLDINFKIFKNRHNRNSNLELAVGIKKLEKSFCFSFTYMVKYWFGHWYYS